jgi:predicted Zn finger-like uncharacterized protein
MPIRFRCEHCQARLSVTARKAGARAKCPKCGEKIMVPATSEPGAAEDKRSSGSGAPSVVEQSVRPPPPPVESAVSAGGERPLEPFGLAPAMEEPVGAERREEPPAAAPPQEERGSAMELPGISPGGKSEPPVDAATTASPPPPSDAGTAPEKVGDPFSQFVVYDDETEWVYEGEDEAEPPTAAGTGLPFDATKVAVPRNVLYMQGALLGVVALISFALGLLIGAGGRDGDGAAVHGPQPAVIGGRIVLRTQGDAILPDQGAAAIVLPHQARPEAKLEIVGLRPQDTQLPDDHPTLRAIRSMGGDYARADAEGRFQLQVADRGHYYVLVISATRRHRETELPKAILAQVGRYFRLAPDLFGSHDYRWQTETVRGDRQLNFAF